MADTVDTVVNELIINKLTQAQFDAIPEAERSDTELYFITDAKDNSLPDQTGNAGKFLTTDGTTASWGEALVNKSAYPDTNIILLGKRSNYGDGQNSKHVIIGLDATVADFASYAVSIGWSASASSYAVAVGAEAKATIRAMQFGSGTNNDADTVKFSNSNGNFEMMDANGNVPLERLTYVTNQIGDISTALTAILGE